MVEATGQVSMIDRMIRAARLEPQVSETDRRHPRPPRASQR